MEKVQIHLTASEREIIPRAIRAGRDYFGFFAGEDCRLSDREAAAFTKIMLDGKDVPEAVLLVVCYGLECLYWKQGAEQSGIPALLEKLEAVCGYQRFGMAAGCIRIAPTI